MTSTHEHDPLYWDDVPEGKVVERVTPTEELGVTGLKRAGGYVDEEFLPALRGRKAVQVFKEMSLNDSIVGALLFAIDKLVREVEWKVVPAQESEGHKEAQEFLESLMDDMSHSWDDFISEVLSMLVYGWSWHEIVFKKRVGPWEKDPKKRSKYTDGRLGIRKMPIRSQETWLRWIFDESGGVRAMVQLAPPHYKTSTIPIEKSLLFRTTISKGNPEGQSLLRTAYRSWYFKKRLEEFEAIGVERDLAGMPVARVPADFLKAEKGTPQAKTVDAFRKMVRGVRRDENEGLVLPQQYDPDTKQPLFDFELMSSGGARQFDTTQIIQRYEQRILMSVLADFILVGHEGVGSYSMHTDKTGIFRAALNAITQSIADTLNRHLVPKVFEANAWKLDELPKFEPTNVDPPDLAQLAAFITATAGAGMQWFPDPELEKFLREIARLPELSDEAVDYKEELLMQQQAMEFATNQMGLLGLKQKAEMASGGYTVEQAEQAAMSPNSDMQQQMAQEEMDAEQVRRNHPVYQEDQAREEAMMQQQQEQMEAQGPMQMALQQQQFEHGEAQAARQMEMDTVAHEREKEKMSFSEQLEEKKYGREKERMSLTEMLEERKAQRESQRMKETDSIEGSKHKRGLEQMKHQGKADEAKTKTSIIQSREQMKAAQQKAKLARKPEKDKKGKKP